MSMATGTRWAVETDGGFEASRPELLFDGPFQADIAGHAGYDVSPDGQKFLMIRNEDTGRVELRVVLNLAEELRTRVPH